MNAKEARELTQKNLKGPVIEPYLKEIHRKIGDAAAQGMSSINNPFSELRSSYPTIDQQDAIWVSLQQDGFVVKHHPDPDPGHPCSGPYTSISW